MDTIIASVRAGKNVRGEDQYADLRRSVVVVEASAGDAGQRLWGAVCAAVVAGSMGLGMLTAATAEPKAVPEAIACEGERFKIALDVGHTREAPGATSARGVREYVFNLRLAKVAEKALKDGGFAQTHLIIARGNTRAQLFKRVERANALGADLFVSIHHNDVQDRYKSKWEHKGKTYAYSDVYAGHALFVSRENARFEDSLAFGRLLGAELKSRGLTYSRHHAEDVPGERRELLDSETGVYRYDRLVVLRRTTMPAVLLEAGIIVNRTEELLLATPEHQARIAGAVLAAIKRFCGAQQSRAAIGPDPPRAVEGARHHKSFHTVWDRFPS